MAQKKFTRETYKKIKKMDRQQMEKFLSKVFDDAYNAGAAETREAAAGKEIDMNELIAKIKEIKGIGEKKATEIVNAINNWRKEL